MAKNLLSEIEQQLADLEEIDYDEPDGDMDPEATIVGTLDDYHRRLTTLQKQYSDQADLRFAEAKQAAQTNSKILAEDWFRKGVEASKMAKVLENLLWLSLRNLHEELRGKPTVFIARGWKVGYLNNEIFMARLGAAGMSQTKGPPMGMVILGSFISLVCVGLLGAIIAVLALGDTHSAVILSLLLAAGIVSLFLMRQKTMSWQRTNRKQ